jgi:hypothetical protein
LYTKEDFDELLTRGLEALTTNEDFTFDGWKEYEYFERQKR